MNNTATTTHFLERGLFPYQAEFAARFFAPNSPRQHTLISSPGTGKTFLAATLIHHALINAGASRVLVLSPSQLLDQWHYRLSTGSSAPASVVVDRRRFRELQDAQVGGADLWPANAVYILSVDFAKRPEVIDALSVGHWDLLVIDEFQLLTEGTQRSRMFTSLIETCPDMRVLRLQVSQERSNRCIPVNEIPTESACTHWRDTELRDLAGRSLRPTMHLEVSGYHRGSDEDAVLKRLVDAISSIECVKSRNRLLAVSLLQAASSSLFALEQFLRRMLHRRKEREQFNQTALRSTVGLDGLGLEDVDLQDAASNSFEDCESTDAFEMLVPLLEDLAGDSKLEALHALLDAIGLQSSPDRRVCVISRFVDTATYLASSLQERWPRVSLVTGGLTRLDREMVCRQFEQISGVLIATTAVKAFIPEVAVVIFYDLPIDSNILAAEIGHFQLVGQRTRSRNIALIAENDLLPIGHLQRRIAVTGDVITSADAMDTLFDRSGESV